MKNQAERVAKKEGGESRGFNRVRKEEEEWGEGEVGACVVVGNLLALHFAVARNFNTFLT